jgi:2-keto-4-pentenoate hydratase/2-oxohepta-3-ene-1,7-dioic acid hydratase in catechol pathway
MFFITFIEKGIEKIGILSEDGKKVIDLNKIFKDKCPESMLKFIEFYDDDKGQRIRDYLDNRNSNKENQSLSIEEVKICAPIPYPRRNILCLGLNYRDHVKEIKDGLGEPRKIPAAPVYFGKMVSNSIGLYDEINSHSHITNEIDYEVELAVIIGKEGINIPREKAEEYLFGYTILNDITARDLQRKHSQWIKGKSLDTFTAMGPYLVHKSRIPFPVALNLSSKVNGELRQSSNTRNFIFDIPYIIQDLSQGMTLKPGDIIATGTPAGVGMGFNPPRFLKSGDVIECIIERIGSLINKVK